MSARARATPSTTDDAFCAVAQTTDVAPGSLISVRLPAGDQVVIVNLEGEIYALRDCCSHEAYPLSAGEVLPDGTIECVWHGARFDCRTGAARCAPAIDDVPSYAVRVEHGVILVGPRRAPR